MKRKVHKKEQKKRWRFLEELHVVGGYYHYMWEALHDGEIPTGTTLLLDREPENVHDANAIAVYTKGGTMLGYIPRHKAVRYAAMMDADAKMQLRVVRHIVEPRRVVARLYEWR